MNGSFQLKGCYAKLDRAAALIRGLNEDVVRTTTRNPPFGLQLAADQNSGDIAIHALVKQDLPLVQWAVVVGDITHNLRSALDNLIWQLATDHQGNPPDPLPR